MPFQDVLRPLDQLLSAIGPDARLSSIPSVLVRQPPNDPESVFSGTKGKGKLREIRNPNQTLERGRFLERAEPDASIGPQHCASYELDRVRSEPRKSWVSEERPDRTILLRVTGKAVEEGGHDGDPDARVVTSDQIASSASKLQGASLQAKQLWAESHSPGDRELPDVLSKLQAWLSRQRTGTAINQYTLRPQSGDYLDDGNDEEEEIDTEGEPHVTIDITTKEVPITPAAREKRKRGTPSSGESEKPTMKHSRRVPEADNDFLRTALPRRHNSRAEAFQSIRNVAVQKERRHSEPSLPQVVMEAREAWPSPAPQRTMN
ncbi:hypothetical protein FRC04_010901, partial [Tulasnella sp. 424]